MGRRTKEEAEITRQNILRAAEVEFDTRGMAQTTLSHIAQRAGVTRGAIYWHFNNKAELFQALLDGLRAPLDELAQASVHEPDPLGRFRALTVQLLHQLECSPQARRLHEILLHKCEASDVLYGIREQRQRHAAACHRHIETTLNQAVSRGQLPADLDTHLAAASLQAYIKGHIALWLLCPGSYSIAHSAERLVGSALEMLTAGSAMRLNPRYAPPAVVQRIDNG